MFNFLKSFRSKSARPHTRTAAPTFRPQLECLEERLAPATLTVTNNNDAGPKSLRQAIIVANANPGSTINFNIGGASQVIFLQSALPAITVPVTIDGTTQPGFNGPPVVELYGGFAGPQVNGLQLFGGQSIVKGLAIEKFHGAGILIVQGGNNQVMQDYIGVDPVGNPDGNTMGVVVAASNTNVISNCVISGNSIYGVLLDASSGNALIQNKMGLISSGQAVANLVAGLAVAAGSAGNVIANNFISGNNAFGAVFADWGTTGNVLVGNTIGLNAFGAIVPNAAVGVLFAAGASGNTLGGATAASANVICGNGLDGVQLAGAGVTNNLIEMNSIGLNPVGNVSDPNGDAGVVLQDGASGNVLLSNNIAANTNVNVRILGPNTNGNALVNNFIGIDSTGFVQKGFVDGVDLANGASGNVLSGNVVGGKNGVNLDGIGTTGNLLQNNLIGTAANGKLLLLGGNNDIGVDISNGAAGNLIGGNTRALGNLISNGQYGILLQSAGTGNLLFNNLIGTNLAGTAALGQVTGVVVSLTSRTQILNNLISGNSSFGVEISNSNNTIVAGNFIGTDTNGSSAVANGDGVFIFANSAGNVIGGATAATRNVISGSNGDGVTIAGSAATGNLVEGNYIGVAADGASALANTQRGVLVESGAHDNVIGGIGAGAGNVIAFNGDDGVEIGLVSPFQAGKGNAVLGNSIFSNVKLGIDLGPDDGVSLANSAGLALNTPSLFAAATLGNSVLVIGNWQSNNFTTGAYRVEIFASPTANASNHGEGKVFLGAATLFVNSTSASFSFVVPNSLGAALSGQVVSATITDPLNNTSEFSNDVVVP